MVPLFHIITRTDINLAPELQSKKEDVFAVGVNFALVNVYLNAKFLYQFVWRNGRQNIQNL